MVGSYEDGNEAGFHKIHRISWLTEQLLASQEELCAIDLLTSADHRANPQNCNNIKQIGSRAGAN
jgi:hypothetical protein